LKCETITLDSFCEQFDIRPNFIKIDVEGAELLAIKGGIKILQKHQPALMVEITQNWSSV
jgi:FkbM family methyltransferase